MTDPGGEPPVAGVVLRRLSPVEVYRYTGFQTRMMLERDAGFQRLGSTLLGLEWARWVVVPAFFVRRCTCFGAFAGKQLMATLFVRDRLGALHIDSMAVHPGWRRHGIGRWLLQHAQHWAMARELPALTLQVTVANAPAVLLYTGSGFRPMHHRSIQLGVPQDRSAGATVGLRRGTRRCARANYARLLRLQLDPTAPWCGPDATPRWLEPRLPWRRGAWVWDDRGTVLGLAIPLSRRRPTWLWLSEPATEREQEAIAVRALGQCARLRSPWLLRVLTGSHHERLLHALGREASDLEDAQMLMVKPLVPGKPSRPFQKN